MAKTKCPVICPKQGLKYCESSLARGCIAADLALENEKRGDLYTEMRAALIRTYEQNQVAIWDAVTVMNFTYCLLT